MFAANPAALQAAGFEPIDWNGQTHYALPGKWIVQLQGIAGSAGKQVNALKGLIGALGESDLKVSKHLGKDGLFSLDSAKDKSFDQIKKVLSKLKGLAALEPDFAVWSDATPNDPSYASGQWALNNTGQSGGTPDVDIDAPEAWDVATGRVGDSVVVGVIDSGVDYAHPDLAANMWKNPGETAGDGVDNDANGYVDDVYGYDFFNSDADPMDDNGHGTHVAGTIAAVGNNGVGVSGVSWGAKVMALKFLGASGSGSTSAAISALNYATKMRSQYGINVRVTNNSWGGGGYSSALQTAVQNHAAAGILFVAAAGNGGADQIGDNNDTTASYPANLPIDNVVAVAATDRNDALGSFSNFGATNVDLAAPGVSILSTTRGGSYGSMSGTSMATPHVAGVAALAAAYKPSATYREIRSALFAGVDKVAALTGKVATGGRLNAAKTLADLGGTPPATPTAPTAPTGLTASAAGSSQIDLSWSAASGNEQGFRVYRSTDGGANFTAVGTTTGTTFANSGLSASTTYHYVVRAYNTAGESADSNTTQATTAAAVSTPAAPTSLGATVANDKQINLAWVDASGNETGFAIERKTGATGTWAQIATVGAGVTGYANTGLAATTNYVYRVRAYNGAGNSAYSSEASATTTAAGIFTNKQDVGAVAATGSATFDAATGTYTVTGSGRDITGSADEFRYAYQRLSGDGVIVARVGSLVNTNSWAKAGLMIRESTAAGSRNAFVGVTPSNGVTFQRRSSTNGGTSSTTRSGVTAPEWLRLTRAGNTFKAEHSADGVTWTQVGATATLTMAADVWVGLAVTSHRDGTLTTAKFDNVKVTKPGAAAAAASGAGNSVFSITRIDGEVDASDELEALLA